MECVSHSKIFRHNSFRVSTTTEDMEELIKNRRDDVGFDYGVDCNCVQ